MKRIIYKNNLIKLMTITLLWMIAIGCQKDEPKVIVKKDPVISWIKPADIVVGTVLSAAQLNASADVPGTFAYNPALGSFLKRGASQDLTLHFTPNDSVNYLSETITVRINVLGINPVINWSNPPNAAVGMTLSAAQLNATADVPGQFTYTPAIGTFLDKVVTQYLTVDFKPNDSENYNPVSKTVRFNLKDTIFFNSQLTYGTISDYDGNNYKTITIGTQTWMAEDLRVTHYRNGDEIPLVSDFTVWFHATTGAYCFFENKPTRKEIYGILYNWYTVDDKREVAPIGWHIPTDLEWITLTDFLGGSKVAGGKMKETGSIHWKDPNTGANNESGFTALPGGYRVGTSNVINGGDMFSSGGTTGGYWCKSSIVDRDRGIPYVLINSSTIFGSTSFSKNWASSIRCIRD